MRNLFGFGKNINFRKKETTVCINGKVYKFGEENRSDYSSPMTSGQKYRISTAEEDSIEIRTFLRKITLRRIVALQNIYSQSGKLLVKKGEKGGFVECEQNLSQKNSCWIFDNAKVFDGARVFDDAFVKDNALLSSSASVFDNAIVAASAKISTGARIFGNAAVYGKATISTNADVYGNAEVYGNATVSTNAEVYGNAVVFDNSSVSTNAEVYGNAVVCGSSSVSTNATVCGNASIKNQSVKCGQVVSGRGDSSAAKTKSGQEQSNKNNPDFERFFDDEEDHFDEDDFDDDDIDEDDFDDDDDDEDEVDDFDDEDVADKDDFEERFENQNEKGLKNHTRLPEGIDSVRARLISIADSLEFLVFAQDEIQEYRKDAAVYLFLEALKDEVCGHMKQAKKEGDSDLAEYCVELLSLIERAKKIVVENADSTEK